MCYFPSFIVLELKKDYEIDSIDLGGFSGNITYLAGENGSGASIELSADKIIDKCRNDSKWIWK